MHQQRKRVHFTPVTDTLAAIVGLLLALPGGCMEGVANGQRVLQEAVTTADVRKEAFDTDGKSLGLEDAGTWTETNLDLPSVSVGDPPYRYHEGASSYVVGSNDSLVVEVWHPFDEDDGGKDMAAVHLNVMRHMIIDTRVSEQDQMSIKLVNKGWGGVVNDNMCDDNDEDVPCPALVIAGTTQMAARFHKGDTLALNHYFQKWADEQGWVLTDDFIKYYFYDFNYASKWIAVPLVSDTRVLAYNKTTFANLNLPEPPGPDEGSPWEWNNFVDTAREITERTGRPGWYFRGSWDEELKISLMIARNWGATFYKEDDLERKSCALGDTFIDAMNGTIEVMLRNNWMSGDFVTQNEKFDDWQNGEWPEGQIDDVVVPDAGNPQFPTNSSELWGMSIVAPITLKDILPAGDIGEAMVPGRFSFLGGSGLFLTEGASEEQQDLGWALLTKMIEQVSTYALVARSPPPLERFLERDSLWADDEWKVPVEQLRSAVPAQYPNPGFSEFMDLEISKPFRLMWLEMKFKNLTLVEATSRMNASVNALLETVCTEDDHDHASCRACDRGDYIHTTGDCDPATQRRTVTFRHEPAGDTECFGGITTPHNTSVSCSHVEVRSRFGVAIITVSCLGGLLAILSAFLVYAYQHRPVIKFSQPRFCVLFSLGVAGMCLSNLALVGQNTGGSCVARVTVWGVAFDLAFGALFSKVYRVRRVLSQAGGRRQRSRRSFLPLVSVVSLAIVVDVLVLTMWSVLDDHGPYMVQQTIGDTEDTVEQEECASEGGPWAIVFISFKILLIAWGCYLAWVTRRINHALVEGREISWSIYLSAVLAMILIFIGSAGLRVEYWALAKAFVYSLSSCTALVMVLVPKLWGAHKNMGVNVHQLTAEATAMRGGSMSLSHTNDMSNDSDGPDAPFIVQCSRCSATFDVTNHFVKGIQAPPPLLAPRAGTGGLRTAVVGGWHGDTIDTTNAVARNRVGTSNVAVGSKSYSSASDSSLVFANVGPKKRTAAAVLEFGDAAGAGRHCGGGGGRGGWAKPGVAMHTVPKLLPPTAPANGAPSVFRETEVGLALKLTKVERGFRRSPASSTGGLPSVALTSGLSGSMGRRGSGFGVPPLAGGTATARKKGSWRPVWRRQAKDDSMLSSSPHSELDAASFSRSLQAQAAAMRAALWSSNQNSQNNSDCESQHKKITSIGKVGSFGRRAAAITPGKGRGRASASPGSMRAALDAGRIAAKAVPGSWGPADPAAAIATTGTVNGSVSVAANPLHIGAGGGRSATAPGRPPAHRVPALRLDTGTDDHNPLVTPPPGRYLLQPWVGGRGTQVGDGKATGVFNLRSARIESHATTSAVSPGLSSAASYSPPVTGSTLASVPGNLKSIASSISPASMTSLTDGFDGDRWGDESKIQDPFALEPPGQAGFGSINSGAARTRGLLLPAHRSPGHHGSALQRGSSALWGTIDKCDDSQPSSPALTDISDCSSMGAARTRKLVNTPVSVYRAPTKRKGAVIDCNNCSAAGMTTEVNDGWYGFGFGARGPAGPEGEKAPAADTLDNDTPAVKGQWARETFGHIF